MFITVGKSRKDTRWKVKEITWSELCARLLETHRTHETTDDYKRMDKDTKSTLKDVGGFVGGTINGGRRVKSAVVSRSLITLDADFAQSNTLDICETLLDYKMVIYSTHSHTPKSPRLRIILPLSRAVTPEEYEPIARMVASDIGINIFDVTTYETSRLMYWPSTSKDGEYIYRVIDGEDVDADATLARYDNWRDTTEWPLGESENTVRLKQAKAQGDPTTKPGLIGLFCRTYDVPDAIEAFIPDVYTPCDDGSGRYTYTGGTTSAGMIVYNDGLFAYSHHSTDPTQGKLCNAFDLVRIHKFGEQDANCDPSTPVSKLPSYASMCAFVREDEGVRVSQVTENRQRVNEAFEDGYFEQVDDIALSDDSWVGQLKTNKQGGVESTTDNVVVILENDVRFKDKLAMNEFTSRPCIVGNLPWRKCEDKMNGSPWNDVDDSSLRHYIETVYGVSNQGKVSDALSVVMQKHAFHPVQNYLKGLKWDGIKRGEQLFIHYLGAEDNLYTRTVTRKWLTAAVARAMVPGIKFDNLVVLVGAQGIGKSYLGNLLGKGWFSDTFGTVQGKESYEQLKGSWIIEIGELSAMKKAEVEAVKMFISKREDNYRAAYGRFLSVNKRQCVFYGTTNDDSFLRDRTGNRRFWPISVDKSKALYDVFDLTDKDIDQLWAEAFQWFKSGEGLYLDAKIAELAADEQDKFMTIDPRQGLIEDYLEMPIPENWYDLDKTARRNYIQGFTNVSNDSVMIRRDSVSVPEMAYELFGEDVLQQFQAKDYHSILTGIPGWKRSGKRPRSIYGRQSTYERTDNDGT